MKLLLPLLVFMLQVSKPFPKKITPYAIGSGQMPALARDEKGIVHIIFGSGDSLLYSHSNNNGHSFTTPELIEVINGLSASATRGPQIAVTNSGVVAIASTSAGNIWSFTKHVGGKWMKGPRINDVDSVNLEGFADVASDGRQDVFAVWLDLGGNRRNKLYGARSADGGKTWRQNIKVYESPDSTICECCRISAVMKGNNVYVLFRNQLYGKRDLHLIRSTDAGKTFGKAEKLGRGSWTLNGCPMDGGGMTVTRDGKIETVWRRESKIYTCEPGEEEVEVGDGKGCVIENINGRNVFAWIKDGEVICKFPNEMKSFGKGSSPALQAVGNNEVICVWEKEKQLYSAILEVN